MKKFDGSEPSGLSDEYEKQLPLSNDFFDPDFEPIPLDEALPLVDQYFYTLDDIDAEQARRDSIREALQPTYLDSKQATLNMPCVEEAQKAKSQKESKEKLSSPYLESDLAMDRNTKAILRRIGSELKKRDNDLQNLWNTLQNLADEINSVQAQLEKVNNSLINQQATEVDKVRTTLVAIQRELVGFREELKRQNTNLQPLTLSIDRLNCRCRDIEESIYYPEDSALTKIDFEKLDKVVCELRSYQEDFRADLTTVETDVKNILDDIENLCSNKLELNSLLEKHTSELSELWQFARRTSREVSEAKASIRESLETLKLRQVLDEQASLIKSQDAVISEMKKRLDTLEASRQKEKPKETKMSPQEIRAEKKTDEEEIKPGRLFLFFLLVLFIVFLCEIALLAS